MPFPRERFRVVLQWIAAFASIVVATLPIVVSQRIHHSMVKEEKSKMELWANATEAIGSDEDSAPVNVMLQIISSNNTIPVILTSSKDSIITFNNIVIPSSQDSTIYLQRLLKKYGKLYKPISINLGEAGVQLLYYGNSSTLHELNLFSLIQLPLFLFLLLILGLAWHLAKRNAQNQLWAGLSKETAHQLGTPISSLMAWIELLRDSGGDEAMLQEMRKDVNRLEIISHRFQKFGSTPQYTDSDLQEILSNSLNYLQSRISKKISLTTEFPQESLRIACNESLLSWVIENLVKNGVDALKGEGPIHIKLFRKGDQALIDISDKGVGIARKNRRKIFHPGFSTKKRGWGLGLSLARRIINEYHKGKLTLLYSEVGEGSTFRIRLPLVFPEKRKKQ